MHFFYNQGIIMTKINSLISLATIDEQIQEIESSQGDLPSRIKKIELEII